MPTLSWQWHGPGSSMPHLSWWDHQNDDARNTCELLGMKDGDPGMSMKYWWPLAQPSRLNWKSFWLTMLIHTCINIVLYFVDGPVKVGKRGCFWSLEVGGQHTEALAKWAATTSFQRLPEIFPLFSESLKSHWTETAFEFFYRTSLTRSWEVLTL